MPTPVWHELGAVSGACSVCAVEGRLTLGEARFRLSLVERARNEHRPTPSRFVTCQGCGWRWPVRAEDRDAAGAGRRAELPRPRRDDDAVATRTVLPEPRHRRSRDWACPTS